MVLHKIFLKGELANKYTFIDRLVQQQDLAEIYKFYKSLLLNTTEFKFKKINYQPELSFLQVILVDNDNTIWKHNYKAIKEEIQQSTYPTY